MRNRLDPQRRIVLVSAGIAIAQTPRRHRPRRPPADAAAGGAAPPVARVDRLRRPHHGHRRRRGALRALSRPARRRLVAVSHRQGDATYLFDASASNVGYRDQRYKLKYDRHRLNVDFLFDSIPTNYSYLTVTPVDGGRQRRADHRSGGCASRCRIAPPSACRAPPARRRPPAAIRPRRRRRSRTGRSTTPISAASTSPRGATRRPSVSSTKPRGTST